MKVWTNTEFSGDFADDDQRRQVACTDGLGGRRPVSTDFLE